MIEEILKELNFGEKEIAIYICVLEHGKLSAATLSRITKINRTTVYSVTKELINKGVITEDIGGSNRYYTALPPEELRNLHNKKQKELEKEGFLVEEAIKKLINIPKNKHYSVPKIVFTEERNLNEVLYKKLPIWIKSAEGKDQNWWGFQDSSFIESHKEWFKYHWEIFPENYGTRLFTNEKTPEKDFAQEINKQDIRKIKYWDKSKEFTATHAVLGDYVLFCVTRQHPYYLVEIHDAVMAENMRQMFKAMWEELS